MYGKDIIKREICFIYVGLLKTYDEVISYLEDNNYSEFTDYWYPCREIKLDGSCSYSDLYGNEYNGENYKIDITLINGGKLYIDNECELSNVKIQVYDMSEVEIEDNVKIKGESVIRCKFQSKISLSRNIGTIGYGKICASFNSNINIGEDFSFGSIHIESNQNSKIVIGNDCMASWDVVIRAGNGHHIFDMETGKNLCAIGRNVIIGDHVWIGQRATLFSGCEIGNGSIVGINTFVNKKFPSNCSIAGNPARIIKENVAWRRESYPYFDSYDDFADFDFR